MRHEYVECDGCHERESIERIKQWSTVVQNHAVATGRKDICPRCVARFLGAPNPEPAEIYRGLPDGIKYKSEGNR